MSTRCNVLIKDQYGVTLYFYRHSDGYPDCAGEDLKAFVNDYKNQSMRRDTMQSAGWLIVRGHFEYKTDQDDGKPGSKPSECGKSYGYGWKVGAYEPTSKLHADVEYVYVIDLEKQTLTCRIPKGPEFWDKPSIANTKALRGFKVDFSAKEESPPALTLVAAGAK